MRSERRAGVAAVHNQLVENYWRLEGEIQDIERGDWTQAYTREVRLDAISAVRSGSPGVYTSLVKEVDKFAVALPWLEDLQRDQIESRKPDVSVVSSESDVVERAENIQEVIVEVEQSMREYTKSSLLRRLIYFNAIEPPEYETSND
jgi:hypothetical protein